jgi:indole-3-glycerol phosphate synthase
MLNIRRRPPNPAVTVNTLKYQVAVPNGQPQNILEEIIWHKETEVEQLRDKQSLLDLQKQVQTAPPVRDFVAALHRATPPPALIAEVKKASPSKGVIRADFDAVAIAQAYEQGGSACLSVLTDERFFQGGFANLAAIRAVVELPLLCKDFVIYPYQLYWARVHGADAVLLLACVLNDQDLQYFVKIAKALGMATLVEVHTLEELDRVLALDGITLVGINNRNLEDFTVDLKTTEELLTTRGQALRDRSITIVSESGLHSRADLDQVLQAGAQAVLIGESLVKQTDIPGAIAQLFEA